MRWPSMDVQKTAPFELGQGEDACLLLHGFTGSPWDLRPLGEFLAGRGYYVRAIRLPGHGTTPDAMAAVTHRDWEQSCEEALASLANFRHVFVAGLSVGALLGLLLAARHPDRVHGLALMAPALRFKDPAMAVVRAARALPVVQAVHPFIRKSGTDLADPKERAEAPVLAAFPTARLADLWVLQEKVLEVLAQITTPALVAFAPADRVVRASGAELIARRLTRAAQVQRLKVEQGRHIMTRDLGRELLLTQIAAFFERLRG